MISHFLTGVAARCASGRRGAIRYGTREKGQGRRREERKGTESSGIECNQHASRTIMQRLAPRGPTGTSSDRNPLRPDIPSIEALACTLLLSHLHAGQL